MGLWNSSVFNVILQISQFSDTRPSPPQNVTVTAVTESSAEVEWTEPAVNAHLVVSYSLFMRKDDRSSNVIEVCTD